MYSSLKRRTGRIVVLQALSSLGVHDYFWICKGESKRVAHLAGTCMIQHAQEPGFGVQDGSRGQSLGCGVMHTLSCQSFGTSQML